MTETPPAPTPLPSTPGEIGAAWLTRAMSARHPGIRVATVEVTEVHEVTNTHVRLRVAYDEAAGAPTTLFCKLPPLDPDRRVLIARTGMGPREARFYAELAPALAFRLPRVSVALHDDRDNSFILVMEDLREAGCTVSDGTWGVSPDSAARALEELADLHGRFEDPARRAAVPWIPGANPDSTYGAVLLREGLDHHRERLSDDFAELAELYIAQSDALQELWHRGPLTVIHGDPHIGNLFDDHGRTGFLDWGIVNVGAPMRDVGYFLTMAMSIDDRRAHEHDLLRHYLDARAAAGATPIPYDEAWLLHRLHAAYTVPACCQIVAFPPGISERRRVFSEAFLARAEAALADLETLAAVHAAGVR
jgi:aminoglycoside phosphotransferase (APT) family kinase protein